MTRRLEPPRSRREPLQPLMRGTNHNVYRSGQWARIIAVEVYAPPDIEPRCCFVVEFADGARDRWPIVDPAAGYEFKEGYLS